MEKERYELLFKDLYGRLPYGVIVEYGYKFEDIDKGEKRHILTGRMLDSYFCNLTLGGIKVTSIKPYLSPMSSMTEEEKEEYESLRNALTYQENGEYDLDDFNELDDFLNRRKLDRYGLIDKGLALEAPDGMYEN